MEIEQLISRKDILALLSEYGRTPEFLKELIERLNAVGNTKALTRIRRLSNLQRVLEIYSRAEWKDEVKIMAVSNFLKYGEKHFR